MFSESEESRLFIFGYLKEMQLIVRKGENSERKEVSNFAKNC